MYIYMYECWTFHTSPLTFILQIFIIILWFMTYPFLSQLLLYTFAFFWIFWIFFINVYICLICVSVINISSPTISICKYWLIHLSTHLSLTHVYSIYYYLSTYKSIKICSRTSVFLYLASPFFFFYEHLQLLLLV